MRPACILAVAAAAAFGACSSGSQGCGGAQKDSSSDGQTVSGGSAAPGGGGAEAVSFQRTRLGSHSADGNMTPSSSTSTALSASTAPARGAAAADVSAPSQSVLCGGFPGLPDDCMASPQLAAMQEKCCPAGIVLACRAFPGGARLTARGCAAPAP